MSEVVKVVIADDHAVVRMGLSHIFEKTKDIKIVAEYNNSKDLLTDFKDLDANIIILDIDMPGNFIIDNIKDILAIDNDTVIIVFSISPAYQFAKRVIESGASGFINKDIHPDLIVDRIMSIYRLAKKNKLALMYHDPRDEKDIKNDLLEKLSSRELCILKMIAMGKSLAKISEELNLSKNTINVHKKNLIQKLELENTIELVIFAVKNKLSA